ncbi:MAG: xanthine dehydrogenase family protein subunit M [Bradyrhizobiaceae bacterium]|nr:xanthine dehydrogenase family protein subunit M [Bradyrhizobiaceae bacterium]
MYNFDFHRPRSVDEAVKHLQAEDAKLLAGGQTLLPTMKQRLAAPKNVIDLNAIGGLSGIEHKGGSLVMDKNAGGTVLRGGTLSIGALTRHAEVAESEEVKQAIPALAALAAGIGDPAVRNRGTIGGSIANNDPAADYPAACLGLGAAIVTNKREISADDFFKGLFETALAADEMILRVVFPAPGRAAYMKFRHPASRFAIVGVFVSEKQGAVRVAVTGAGQSGVFRVPAMEKALAERFEPDAIEGIKIDPSDLVSDIHAAADYRAHLIGVMAQRAVKAAG